MHFRCGREKDRFFFQASIIELTHSSINISPLFWISQIFLYGRQFLLEILLAIFIFIFFFAIFIFFKYLWHLPLAFFTDTNNLLLISNVSGTLHLKLCRRSHQRCSMKKRAPLGECSNYVVIDHSLCKKSVFVLFFNIKQFTVNPLSTEAFPWLIVKTNFNINFAALIPRSGFRN